MSGFTGISEQPMVSWMMPRAAFHDVPGGSLRRSLWPVRAMGMESISSILIIRSVLKAWEVLNA